MPDKKLPCCPQSTATHLRDLDHVYQFDFDLYQCDNCKKRWVWAWWYGHGGWEPVAVPDAELMMTIPDAQLRAYMKQWAHYLD